MRRAILILAFVFAAIVVVPLAGAWLLGWGTNPAAVPPAAKAVPVGAGRTLNVLEVGAGPPVVLVHGLPSNIGDWAEVPARLAELGHRVVVYDRAGYGHSSRDDAKRPGTYTYASNARDLLALLDALGIGRATLAGWSYGGAIVQEFAAQHPERVAQVAFLGSVGPAAPPDEDALSRILASGAGEEILRWAGAVSPIGAAFTRENLRMAFARERDVPPGFVERTRAMLALPGTLEAFVAEAQRGDPSSLRPEAIAAPALVLHGTEDLLVPLAVGQDLDRRLPDSQILIVPGGSHMLPVTHVDLVAGALHALATEHGQEAAGSSAPEASDPSRLEP